jgi:hypothetical protein
MPGPTDRLLELVAVHQARRRAFNERLSQLDEAGSDDRELLFRCECGLISCAATIRLSADDYAAIRATPRRFAVHADHVIPEAEHVVATQGGHAIVEKPLDAPVPPAVRSTRITEIPSVAPRHEPAT